MYAAQISIDLHPEMVGRVLSLSDRWADDNATSPLSDHIRLALLSAPVAKTAMVVTLVSDDVTDDTDEPEIVAIAVAVPGAEGMICEVAVQPNTERHDFVADIVVTMAQALLADVSPFRTAAEHSITLWVDDEAAQPPPPSPWLFEVDRTLLQMRRPIVDSATPLAHVHTRSFVPGRDDQAWLAVNNLAFAGHPEQAGWDQTVLAQRLAEPWFDAAGFRIYEQDGQIAAFCWTKIHRDTKVHRDTKMRLEEVPLTGEIYVIAVHPDFHGQGLGRELTLAGLDAITASGASQAILYVDAENAAAVHLYRSLEFDVERTRTAYRVRRHDETIHPGHHTPGP